MESGSQISEIWSCFKEYVDKNMYLKPDDQQGLYYKVDSKEYKVFLTYCKPVDKQ